LLAARPKASIKSSLADWRVEEQLVMEFAGSGEHACFFVEKRGLNTADVARGLAQAHGVDLVQIGYCGLKDKHGITRQWFSVPTPDGQWRLAMPDVHCLQTARHSHKLRRGQHAANRFDIRLCDVEEGAAPAIDALVGAYPNYFGPQRVSSGNVQQALAWLGSGKWGSACAPRRRRQRKLSSNNARKGWHISVLRSMLFNEVLKLRVGQHNYVHGIAGDVMDAGVPTGPLWGRGRSAASGAAAALERAALAAHAETCDALEYAGVNQGRRQLAVTPQQFAVERGTGWCELSFLLPTGAYATSMLGHRLELADKSKRHE